MSHLLYHNNMPKIAKAKIWPLRTLGVKILSWWDVVLCYCLKCGMLIALVVTSTGS
jgi:hypothetical protein